MENKQELIVLEQLPIIKTYLEELSKEIKIKVNNAVSLVVNEETVKDVKQVRADLNKDFKELEEQRKKVKLAIMSKYDEFEEIYKENVSDIYKSADVDLKNKIDDVENKLKEEKKEELELFAKEHFTFNNIEDVVNFNDIGLNITLSASMKSLKEQVLKFCEKISNDIKLIELEEYKEEILLEYKNNLDLTKSKLNVLTRHKQLEELRKKEEEKQLMFNEEDKIVEVVEKVIEEEITAPVEIIEDEELLTVTFTITDTKENIIKLREFMKKEGIKYE